MNTVFEIRPMKEAVEDSLLKKANVQAVGIAPKYVGGKRTDELSITVYVEKKKEKSKLSKDDLIPPVIEGTKTDVVEAKFELHPLKIPVPQLEVHADSGRYDPLTGGISIGPCRVINGQIFAGTLGVVVVDNATNAPMLLSNFHVMCVDNQWQTGDTMTQPSRIDSGNCPVDIVGSLQRALLNESVDCAIASCDSRNSACTIVDIGDVTGTAIADLNMPVRKRGRTTGLTYGTVETVDLTVRIDYGDGLGTVTLTRQIGIRVDATQSSMIGTHGDSGSVVVNDSRQVVGLYFGGSSDGTLGIANPIQEVLNALNVNICSAAKPKETKETKEFKVEIKEKDESFEKQEEKDPKELFEVPPPPTFPPEPPPSTDPGTMAKTSDIKPQLKSEAKDNNKELLKSESKEHNPKAEKIEWKEHKAEWKEHHKEKDKEKEKEKEHKQEKIEWKEHKIESKEHNPKAEKIEWKEHKAEWKEAALEKIQFETPQPLPSTEPGTMAKTSDIKPQLKPEAKDNNKELLKSEWKEHKAEWKEHHKDHKDKEKEKEHKQEKIEWKEHHKTEWKEAALEKIQFETPQPRHFIDLSKRPDLIRGALSREADRQQASSTRQSDETKQSKDNKDRGKVE